MPNTYVALATYTVTGSNLSGPTGITFTGISSAYTDLRIVQNVTLTAAAIGYIQVGNGSIDTAANYSRTSLSGDGSSASSARTSSTNQISTQIAHQGTTIGTYTADFMNYSNTTTNKTVLIRNNNTGFGTEAVVGLWRSNTAINTVKLFLDRAEFYVVGSTFSLYGIANADQGSAKATGGIITEDSQYWYHTFGASGAFVPKQSLTCDVLVVAGGGGGGNMYAGGGGAGGVAYQTGRSVPVATYNITVGAGGVSVGSGSTSNGNNGSNSIFDTITANGGGGGGSYTIGTGNTGGSGGGAAMPTSNGTIAGGAANQGTSGGATGYGNAGGASLRNGGIFLGGGGGGAGAAGSAASGSIAGVGGVGLTTWSSWGPVTGIGENVSGTYYLAGGGGGGAEGATASSGGFGGGGRGGQYTVYSPGNGLTNTGGGGGAVGGALNTGAAGGSGIVIIRYSK